MSESRTSESSRRLLTRALGLDDGVQADLFGPIVLRSGEAVLLCTDGLHGLLDDATIGRLAARGQAHEIVRALIAAANAAGGRDNVSVALARRTQ